MCDIPTQFSETPASLARVPMPQFGGQLPIMPPPPVIPPPIIAMIVTGIIVGLVMACIALFNPVALPVTIPVMISNCLSCIACLVIVYFVAQKYKQIGWALAIIFIACLLSVCSSMLMGAFTGVMGLQTLRQKLNI